MKVALSQCKPKGSPACICKHLQVGSGFLPDSYLPQGRHRSPIPTPCLTLYLPSIFAYFYTLLDTDIGLGLLLELGTQVLPLHDPEVIVSPQLLPEPSVQCLFLTLAFPSTALLWACLRAHSRLIVGTIPCHSEGHPLLPHQGSVDLLVLKSERIQEHCQLLSP